MRINKLKIDEDTASKVGLKEIQLERLGTVVALIGKNGSGKTRILNLIEQNFSKIGDISNFSNGNLSEPPDGLSEALIELKSIDDLSLRLKDLETITLRRNQNPNDSALLNEYAKVKARVKQLRKSLKAEGLIRQGSSAVVHIKGPEELLRSLYQRIPTNLAKVKQNYFKRISYSEIRELQQAIPGKEEVDSFESLIESISENIDYNELGTLHKSSLGFLLKLPHQLASDFIDCLGDQNKLAARVSYKRYVALKGIFYNFFSKDLAWDIKNVEKKVTQQGVQSLQVGVWKINDREFNYSEFSDGEKTLFAFVLLFFLLSQNPKLRLKESIILIDEPELHLHPDAEIDLINGIRNIIQDRGQLWIATHSINILSHINYDEVFMVKEGVIKRPSSSIQKETLSELMGVEQRVQKLSEFLTSISEWTYVNFMIQCFTDPDVIETAKENDPQVEAFKTSVKNTTSGRNSLLLDFGAGKGRLYEQAVFDESFKAIIDYSALEPNESFHGTLKAKGIDRIFSSYDELPENVFDYVVLCNVLHEIEISSWIPTLNKVIRCLKETGYLIIIEAKTLSKGEKIGTIGYLILDETEIRELFQLNETTSTINHKDRIENITCALLPKKELRELTESNLISAMKKLESNTLIKLEQLRLNGSNTPTNTKFGRESAFLSQLHINARLALKYFENKAT